MESLLWWAVVRWLWRLWGWVAGYLDVLLSGNVFLSRDEVLERVSARVLEARIPS